MKSAVFNENNRDLAENEMGVLASTSARFFLEDNDDEPKESGRLHRHIRQSSQRRQPHAMVRVDKASRASQAAFVVSCD